MKKLFGILLSIAMVALIGLTFAAIIPVEAGLLFAVTAPGVTAIARASTEDIGSMHDFQFKPEVFRHLYQKFGNRFTLVDELRNAAGRETMISNETLKTQMEDYYHTTVKLASASSGGATAGAEGTFVLHADSLDDDNNYYIREKFSVFTGSVANGIVENRVTDITVTGGGATVTVTIKPYDQTLTIGTIASGTELAIGPSAFAGETGQPGATSSGLFEHEHYAQIFKETKAFGGPEFAKEKWVHVEGVGWYNQELARGEFLLDLQQEAALLMGQKNTNSITQVSQMDGKNLSVKKSIGIWTWIEELGGDMTWNSTDGFDLDDFATITDYQISQGLSTEIVQINGGITAIRAIEEGLTDFITAGQATDFTKMLGSSLFKGRTERMLDYGFTTFRKDGITFILKDLDLFNNPTLFGLSGYNLKGSAFIIPMSNLKDAKSGLTIPNLQARYVGMGAYSRKRVIRVRDGMSGWSNASVNDVDGVNANWLAHIMYVLEEANKCMLLKQTA